MSRFYLAPFVGNGSGKDPFRPPVTEPFSIIDLRGDSTRREGFNLLATEGPMPADAALLADSLDASVPLRVSRRLEDLLSLTLDSKATLREIIVELMLRHATPNHDRSRWNRIHADSRGWHRIVLGNELIYDAPDILNVVVTDDFSRANEALETSTSWSVSDADFDIVSNELNTVASGGRRTAWWDDNTFGPNMYTQAQCVNVGSLHGLLVRYNGVDPDTTGSLYSFHNTDTATDWVLEKVVSGSVTTLATTGTRTAGLWRLEADGSSIVGLLNGAEAISTTDTDITVAGFGGFWASNFQGDNESTWDNFEAGDIVAGFGGMLLPGVG